MIHGTEGDLEVWDPEGVAAEVVGAAGVREKTGIRPGHLTSEMSGGDVG